jgi:hypothetical protein
LKGTCRSGHRGTLKMDKKVEVRSPFEIDYRSLTWHPTLPAKVVQHRLL